MGETGDADSGRSILLTIMRRKLADKPVVFDWLANLLRAEIVAATWRSSHREVAMKQPRTISNTERSYSISLPYGRIAANVRPERGNNYRSPVLLTDAQSQGTKVASTVARDGKTEGISRLLN
ncbi:hypothetical protein EGT36_20700 [Agrobacterium sp. FDAARGOS_525]|nr:hypothetical protein EGT36_20700 [Agrobacterium sp. FDAARGOS_525]